MTRVPKSLFSKRPRLVALVMTFLVTVFAALAAGVGPLSAHPHVFVTAVSELIYAPDGSLTGVRHAWTFDDMFSSYAIQGLESKTKTYTREELAPLAQINVDSLKEYGFFTFAKADGHREHFQDPPVDYYLDYKNGMLTLHFTLMLKTPVKPRQLVLEIYDRTFFVEFQMAKEDPVKLRAAPAGCQMKLDRPDGGGAVTAQALDEQTFIDGENKNFGARFSNKITVDCP